jgi:F0F1-type ATP synthase assembly protein I
MGQGERWSNRARRWVRGRTREASTASLMHLGLTYAASVALYGLGGWWLDGRLGTLPLFTLLGVLLGAFAGFLWIYREVQRAENQERRDRQRDAAEAVPPSGADAPPSGGDAIAPRPAAAPGTRDDVPATEPKDPPA